MSRRNAASKNSTLHPFSGCFYVGRDFDNEIRLSFELITSNMWSWFNDFAVKMLPMTWLTAIKFNLLDIVPVTVQGLVNYDPSADTWIMSRDEIHFRLIPAAHFSSLHTWLLHNFLFSFHVDRLRKGYQNIATTCSSPIGAPTIFGAVEYIFRLWNPSQTSKDWINIWFGIEMLILEPDNGKNSEKQQMIPFEIWIPHTFELLISIPGAIVAKCVSISCSFRIESFISPTILLNFCFVQIWI